MNHMKYPRCMKIAALLLALSLIEPRLAYADATADAAQAAKNIDAANKEAEANIPAKDIKEKEDAYDKAGSE